MGEFESTLGKFESFIGVDFWTALFVLLNTLAIFFVTKKLLFKPVHKLITDRQSEIDSMYKKADEAKRSAENLEQEYRQKLAQAGSEADRIVKEATVRAENKGEEILAGAKSDAAAVISKAQRDAELEKRRAVNDAKNEIASMAVSIAEKVVERKLDDSGSQELVDEFISRLDRINE